MARIKKVEKNQDLIYGFINNFREQITHTPPANTLSYYVFHKNLDELKKILLSSKYNVNSRDENGISSSWTPLYWAVKLRDSNKTKILLEYGASINIVINDLEECCGTVLDLATLRNDEEIEKILRDYIEKEDVSTGQSFKAIRTKLRGKAPSFNFRQYK